MSSPNKFDPQELRRLIKDAQKDRAASIRFRDHVAVADRDERLDLLDAAMGGFAALEDSNRYLADALESILDAYEQSIRALDESEEVGAKYSMMFDNEAMSRALAEQQIAALEARIAELEK